MTLDDLTLLCDLKITMIPCSSYSLTKIPWPKKIYAHQYLQIYVMQGGCKRRWNFTGVVNFESCFWCIRVFSQLKNDTPFIKIDQGIQILQLKMDQIFLLSSISKRAHSHKAPSPWMCCIILPPDRHNLDKNGVTLTLSRVFLILNKFNFSPLLHTHTHTPPPPTHTHTPTHHKHRSDLPMLADN